MTTALFQSFQRYSQLRNSRIIHTLLPRYAAKKTANRSRSATVNVVSQHMGLMQLLSGTYVPPKLRIDTLQQNPKLFLRLIYQRVACNLSNIFLWAMLKFQLHPRKIKLKLLKEHATELYKTMNREMAKGNLGALERITTLAYFEKLKHKVERKNKKEKSIWKLYEMISSPKIVSFRVSKFDAIEPMFVAQAVVRFHSIQSLSTYDKDNRVIEGKRKEVVEHMVIQSKTWENSTTWLIQGSIGETPERAVKTSNAHTGEIEWIVTDAKSK